MVSHGLGNLVGVIALSAGALLKVAEREGLDQQAVLKTTATIQRTADRMARLIADLLDTQAIEAGRLRIDSRPHDVAALVRDEVEALSPLGIEKGIWIEAKPPSPGTLVPCDPDRFRQVVRNLVGNAIKYSRKGTTVTVKAELGRDEAAFSVSDEGPGMPPEQLAHVFDRGFRGKTADASTGHGMGLYISKAIVEAHGGRMWAESMLSVGSTFHFALPLVPGIRA